MVSKFPTDGHVVCVHSERSLHALPCISNSCMIRTCKKLGCMRNTNNSRHLDYVCRENVSQEDRSKLFLAQDMPRQRIINLPLRNQPPPLSWAPSNRAELCRWAKERFTVQVKKSWDHILTYSAANFLWVPSWPKARAVNKKMSIGLGPMWEYAHKQNLLEFPDEGARDDIAVVCRACGWLTGNRPVIGPRCAKCGDDAHVCEQCMIVTGYGLRRCAVCSPTKQEPEEFHALHIVQAGCDVPLDGLMMEGTNYWRRRAGAKVGVGCLNVHRTLFEVFDQWYAVTCKMLEIKEQIKEQIMLQIKEQIMKSASQ